MEIYQIRAFVTVARLGNLTRAAEALSLTQPEVRPSHARHSPALA
jgi:DNA-binding transcriptional LysR family regulator